MPSLYARVFVQILDSSLAEDWQTRHVFEDFLKLADESGIVDMTRESISRRTNIPLEIINRAIDKLESADPNSRDPEAEGRRIDRIDIHRDWGWIIVNYVKYAAVRSKDDERELSRRRSKRYRDRKKESSPDLSKKEPEVKVHPDPEEALRVTPRHATTVTGGGVEFPTGFPSTVEEAINGSMSVGIPEAFVRKTWNKAAGRNGLDSKMVPIRRWANYLSTEWSYEQDRIQKSKPKKPYCPNLG